jgi:hypothetical protein
MNISQMAGAAFRALTARKDGPSIYDVCDPVLLNGHKGDEHLVKFYKTALRNPALKPLLWRAGLPELVDARTITTLREALTQALEQGDPDWAEIGRPFADLLDTIQLSHPKPKPVTAPAEPPQSAELDRIIRSCGKHLLGSFARNGFLPTYAAFNLIGDPDFRGRELIAALTGLNARSYKNSTLMFNLARVFIARSPTGDLLNPSWKGIAEPMWEPVQIRHRSAYYDAFFIEALLTLLETGLTSSEDTASARRAIDEMVEFCLGASSEEVLARDGTKYNVITALAPPPHPRFSRFFSKVKEELGFGIYVPDCDTTACSFSAATQAGSNDPILDQPLLDFYTSYQVRAGSNETLITVPLNDNIGYEGAIATWIDNLAGERPYGNDLDPTLNLDVLEVSFRNCDRWKVLETPSRLETIHRIIAFQRSIVASGAFTDPRAHIYYLPELYSAYFGRCYATFRGLPAAAQRAIDPNDTFGFIRAAVLRYVTDELVTREMNAFDAALALLALGHLGGERRHFTPALHTIVESHGEGSFRAPYKAYEWNKMKTPTRILVGGPEVTSAFVLMGLAVARHAMNGSARPS